MIRSSRRKWFSLAVILAVLAGLSVAGLHRIFNHRVSNLERSNAATAPPKPEAPPDLAKLRNDFTAGLDALRHKDGPGVVRTLGSFRFGNRAVEEYRLWYLAQGQQLAGDNAAARGTLAHLWARDPRLVPRDDAGFALAAQYDLTGSARNEADVLADIAISTPDPDNAARARWSFVQARLAAGDLDAVLYAARNIVIKSPRSKQAGDAIAVVRALSGQAADEAIRLSPEERLERAVSLMRDGDPQSALDELTALEPAAPASIRQPIALNRGLALFQLRRFDEATRVFEPLTSDSYKIAIPALYFASKSYRALSASINPIVVKQVIVKQQVAAKAPPPAKKPPAGKGVKGTPKTASKTPAAKGKKVAAKTAKKPAAPKFANVKKNVQLVDLAKKAQKDSYDRLANERFKDLLSLPIAKPIRVEVLNTLIAIAESKNQDPYEQQLIVDLIRTDPLQDPGLQHLWDKGWAAYARGDLNGAKPLFRFIADTYRNPNVRRQSEYWYARTIERLGQKQEAAASYAKLASASYDDIYALDAIARGAPRKASEANPLTSNRPDWSEIAEKQMPPELRLAYELTALSDMRDAQLEIQRNFSSENQPYADALQADLLNSAGDSENMYKVIRRAFPQLATAEQDSVPPYFLKMYYRMRYESSIKKYAQHDGVDPYLVMALILQESYFDPAARSRVGAIGLMQLMPATGKELGGQLHRLFNPKRLSNPDTNIEIGTLHVKHLIDLFDGNTQLAVASYNAGQGNVQKWRRAAPSKPMDEFLESIPFPETRNYVKRVTMLQSTYRRLNS